MSMLQAQVDELRELATRYDELQVGAVKAVTMPSDIGSILREAADTIWELRNRCADFVDERERLFRSNVEKNGEVLRLVSENAKLRELFDMTYGYYVSGTLAPCDICGKYDCEGNAPTTCKADEYDPDGMVVEEIERRMRELGVDE